MLSELILDYLRSHPADKLSAGMLAYLANLECVAQVSPQTARSIVRELADQRSNIKLIASENYCSLATQSAMANLFSDKYSEGFPHKRFYAGCDNVDDIESNARDLACQLFGSDHAYVQPHSGADANMVAFWAILTERVEAPALRELGLDEKDALKASPAQWEQVRQRLGNQRLLAMDLFAGGHLTHGYRFNVSAKMFDVTTYGVNRETGLLDYDEIQRLADQVRPLILLAGYSSYPRKIDFRRMREIADRVGAVFMVDMAHFAGLVAARVFDDQYHPIPHAHVVTSTTHKTLRGPRGGLVLCTSEFAGQVDRGCPLMLGGPLPHVMAAKAVAFTEALRPEFQQYAQQIVDNARQLGESFQQLGLRVLTGGTDNHLVVLDVSPRGLTGRQAESVVRECGITLNRNTIPFDENGPWYTSGLRVGTAAVTTLGMQAPEMREIAAIVHLILSHTRPARAKDGSESKAHYVLDDSARQEARSRVAALLDQYPVYPELDLGLLERCYCTDTAAAPVT